MKEKYKFLPFTFLSILLFILTILVYTWLITNGDFNLFKHTRDAFDFLSTSLLNFNCSVKNGSIGWEAYIVNGKSYMYFGPFSAILRIIPNFFFPALFGKWSVLSCIFSSVLCVLGFSILIIMVLKDNDSLSKELKYFFFFVSQLTFAFGTPIFFLMSVDSAFYFIFHEVILWALAFSIFSIVYLYKLIKQKDGLLQTFFLFSTCVGLSFLSRASFGMPLYIIWIACIARLVISSKQPILKVLIASSPACLALIYQLWYNFCRFGNVLTFANFKYYYPWILHTSEYERFEKIGGIFNLKRIPITLFNYLGLRSEYFSSTPPFFNFSLPKLSDPSIFMGYQEHVISLTVVSLFFIVTSIISLFWMIKEKKCFFTKFCALSFLGQVIFILSYNMISHRYSADLMPFLVFMYAYFISKIGNRTFLAIDKSAKFIIILTIFFSLFSLVTTVFSTFGEVRKVYWDSIIKLLPRSEPIISYPLRIGMKVRFNRLLPGKSEPLLTLGKTEAGDFIYVKYLPDNKIILGHDHWSAPESITAPLKIDPNKTYSIEVYLGSMDENITSIKMNNQLVLKNMISYYPVRAKEIVVGKNNIGGGSCSSSFSGKVESYEIVESLYRSEPINHPLRIGMKVRFNRLLPNKSEPLLTLGKTEAGDFIYVKYLPDNKIILGHDHWSAPESITAPLKIDPNKTYSIEVYFGSMDENITSIKIDDQLVLKNMISYYPARVEEIDIGKNNIGGGSCSASFSGKVESYEIVESLSREN